MIPKFRFFGKGADGEMRMVRILEWVWKEGRE